jgi:hypothetical protein
MTAKALAYLRARENNHVAMEKRQEPRHGLTVSSGWLLKLEDGRIQRIPMDGRTAQLPKNHVGACNTGADSERVHGFYAPGPGGHRRSFGQPAEVGRNCQRVAGESAKASHMSILEPKPNSKPTYQGSGTRAARKLHQANQQIPAPAMFVFSLISLILECFHSPFSSLSVLWPACITGPLL